MLILRGKRIGLSLQEIRELFDLYDADDNNASQLQEFIRLLQQRERQLLDQMEDIRLVLKEITQQRQQCERLLARRRKSPSSEGQG
ncbi:MerR family DNA-binding protein [Paludibacterium denitrificans]|uniref:MerR family DNA-binding protein n=1 Tax=Paludibacterium denitrificans TaxID=2675226 RepID=UPI001E437EB1|nr:MerR family DNA-binding protein [Paludibacterium denitrificans]